MMTTWPANTQLCLEPPGGGRRVGVVGAGIGGLTAALSLLRAGFDVHVFEQACALREAGAGVQLSPNASRILHRLGLADDLAGAGVKPVAWHQRRWDDGSTLLRAPLADPVEDAFGCPYYVIHRADLLYALAAAVPLGRIHLGRRLTGLCDRGDHVEARFANGASAEVDVLVGADGIQSAVRRELFGAQRPRYSGCVAYRGLVPTRRVRHLDLDTTVQMWMGPGRHFVHYFVRARELVSFVAVVEKDWCAREAWAERGDPTELRVAFRGWHRQVQGILEAAEDPTAWALHDRAPLGYWSAGRVTLLGDACHPKLSFMAQGAAQAIEDAATLAACLAAQQPADTAAALRRYERLRIPRTSRLQAMSDENQLRLHLPDGAARPDRDAHMATGNTDGSLRAVSWIYRHDAHAIDATASHDPARRGKRRLRSRLVAFLKELASASL